jgi:hypothetical protein
MFLPERLGTFSLQSHPLVMGKLAAGLGGHQDFLIGDMRGWGAICDEGSILHHLKAVVKPASDHKNER